MTIKIGAILPSAKSERIRAHIQKITASLNLYLDQPFEVIPHMDLSTEDKFRQFAEYLISHRPYDVLWALSPFSCLQARRLFHEYAVRIPTLLFVIGTVEQDVDVPHINTLKYDDDSAVFKALVSTLDPPAGKTIICGSSSQLATAPTARQIKNHLKEDNRQVVPLILDRHQLDLDVFMQTRGKGATSIIAILDPVALQSLPQLRALADKYNCSLFAAGHESLAKGADISVGFPLENIDNEVALGIAETLAGKHFLRSLSSQPLVSLAIRTSFSPEQIEQLTQALPSTHQLRFTHRQNREY